MSDISEIYRVRQRAIEYAIKHNNSKAAVKYKTSRQQIKCWRDRYDSTVQSLLPKSRRPKSHRNQHTQEEIELVMKKYRKFGYEGLVGRSHRLDSKYYADKKFKSKEELLRSIKKYNTRYNNISRKVLGFKSPNEVLKEYKQNH